MTERDEALRLARAIKALPYLCTQEQMMSLVETLLAEHARAEAMRGVVEASVQLRIAESTDVPGESIAELEANVPAAQRRTAIALLRWRAAIDAHRSGSKS